MVTRSQVTTDFVNVLYHMCFELPFVSSYSLKFQLTTLTILLAISYLHRGTRLTLACLATLYLAFLCIVPIIRWTYYIFKAIAMFGFYVHYFYMGLGFLLLGIEWVINDGLDYVAEKLERREQEQDGRRRRRGRR